MIIRPIQRIFAIITTEWHAIRQFQKEKGARYFLLVMFLPVCVPLLLIAIHYAVSRGIKSQYTISQYVYLNYSSPNIVSIFLSNYAHNLQNVSHLISNILYFEIIVIPILILNYYLFPIHNIRFSKKFFRYSCFLTFILGPFVISGLSLYFGRMLNYELGVGFSGINWAFAGLLFFLIISVMFRYLKKNTICGDALITIHAGIVVMSFVMFFPVCVILSSIKYGGTNVFAHMSGYLFGWLTFPLLAFLLEVSERKNPPGIASQSDIPGTSGLLRIQKLKDHISAISVHNLLRFRSLTVIKDPLIIRSRFVKLNTGDEVSDTCNVPKPVRSRLLIFPNWIHRQTRSGPLPIRTDTTCIIDKKHNIHRFLQISSFISWRKKGISNQKCSDPVHEEISTQMRVHPGITWFSFRKRHNPENASSLSGEGFRNKRVFLGFIHKNKETLLLPQWKNQISVLRVPWVRRNRSFRDSHTGMIHSTGKIRGMRCIAIRNRLNLQQYRVTQISRQSLSNRFPRVSTLFYRTRRVFTLPFSRKKNLSGIDFTDTMPDNGSESNSTSYDIPFHSSEPDMSQPEIVSSLPFERTCPRDKHYFSSISLKNLICASGQKVCQCSSHIFFRLKRITVFLSPILISRKPKKAAYTISLLDELFDSSNTGNSVSGSNRTRYSLFHPVKKITSAHRHVIGTIQKYVHNRSRRRKNERISDAVSLFERESVECSHTRWKERLKKISLFHRMSNNISEKSDKYQK